MMKSSLVLALIATVTALSAICSDHAEASQPYMRRSQCFVSGGAGNMGRGMGERNAQRIVNAIWARLGNDCSQLDRLAQIISETPIARSARPGEFGACFYLGYTDQLYGALDDIYDRCGQACFNAGGEIGSISAQGYCAASLAVGGLLDPGFIAQPPLPFCGSALVMGCKSEYVATATMKFPGCAPFTEGWFTDTFDNSVRQDCFVPSDVPIRDRYTLDRFGSVGVDAFLM